MKSAGPYVRRLAALALVAMFAASCGGDGPEAPTAPSPQVPLVVALGDSLTAGYGLRPDEAYPAVLQRRLTAANYRVRIVNAGVNGDTSADALDRLDAALQGPVRILIVALGANDGIQGVPVAEMTANLSTIIDTARRRGVAVLLCGIEAPPLHGLGYSIAFHAVFPQLAARFGIPLMPFLLSGVVGRFDLNLGDGVHPNAAGARVIAENLWPYLQPMVDVVVSR